MRHRGALKHGAYSESVLLSGEDPRKFRMLHAQLVEELAPEGRLQEEIVAAIAALMWRRQNLKNLEVAPLATLVANALSNALLDERPNEKLDAELRELAGIYESEVKQFEERDKEPKEKQNKETKEKPDKEAKRSRAKQEQAERRLFGDSKIATLALILKEYDVQDRIDSMIDKHVKRLCYLKTLAPVAGLGSYQSPIPRMRSRGSTTMEGNAIEQQS
jgi:DNA primase